jgi:hypothetical protein
MISFVFMFNATTIIWYENRVGHNYSYNINNK